MAINLSVVILGLDPRIHNLTRDGSSGQARGWRRLCGKPLSPAPWLDAGSSPAWRKWAL